MNKPECTRAMRMMRKKGVDFTYNYYYKLHKKTRNFNLCIIIRLVVLTRQYDRLAFKQIAFNQIEGK